MIQSCQVQWMTIVIRLALCPPSFDKLYLQISFGSEPVIQDARKICYSSIVTGIFYHWIIDYVCSCSLALIQQIENKKLIIIFNGWLKIIHLHTNQIRYIDLIQRTFFSAKKSFIFLHLVTKDRIFQIARIIWTKYLWVLAFMLESHFFVFLNLNLSFETLIFNKREQCDQQGV